MTTLLQTGTEQEPIDWVGLDVAKASFDAALVRAGQHFPQTPLRNVPVRTFPRTREGVQALWAWLETLDALADGRVRVCMEATGRYSIELAVWLLEQDARLEPAIVNPQQTADFRKSMGLRNKTDRLEARALAFYGAERRPAPYEPLTPEHAQLRALSRYRDALVREKVAEENRTEETSQSKLVRRLHTRRLRQLDKDLDTVELGDLRRFGRARQLTAFAGVSPRIKESGTSVHARPRMCKRGNPRVRQVLYLAAMTATRKPSDLQAFYLRLIKQGKCPKAALGALMRKLLTIMRAMEIRGEPYHLWHHACE